MPQGNLQWRRINTEQDVKIQVPENQKDETSRTGIRNDPIVKGDQHLGPAALAVFLNQLPCMGQS